MISRRRSRPLRERIYDALALRPEGATAGEIAQVLLNGTVAAWLRDEALLELEASGRVGRKVATVRTGLAGSRPGVVWFRVAGGPGPGQAGSSSGPVIMPSPTIPYR